MPFSHTSRFELQYRVLMEIFGIALLPTVSKNKIWTSYMPSKIQGEPKEMLARPPTSKREWGK